MKGCMHGSGALMRNKGASTQRQWQQLPLNGAKNKEAAGAASKQRGAAARSGKRWQQQADTSDSSHRQLAAQCGECSSPLGVAAWLLLGAMGLPRNAPWWRQERGLAVGTPPG